MNTHSVFIQSLCVVLTLTSALPVRASSDSCADLFRVTEASAQKLPQWNLQTALDTMAQIDPRDAPAFHQSVDWVGRITTWQLSYKLNPEALRTIHDFDSAVRAYDKAIEQDRQLRDVLHRRFLVPERAPVSEWVRREIIRDGLISLSKNYPNYETGSAERILIQVRKLLDNPWIRRPLEIVALQNRLPDMNDMRIDKNLLAEQLVYGWNKITPRTDAAHRDTQAYIDAYRQLRPAYAVAAFLLTALLVQHEAQVIQAQLQEEKHKRAKAQFKAEMESMDEGLDAISAELDRRGLPK